MVKTFINNIYKSFATHISDSPARLLSFFIFVFLVVFPITNPTKTFLNTMIGAFIIAIFVSSWDLLVGRCGQFSFGHALFFGIGAYVTALLIRYVGWPIWVTIPIAVLVTTLISIPAGFPALRVRGPYLALTSMALPLIGTGILLATRDVSGGESGLGPNPRFFPGINYEQQWVGEYYLLLFLLLFSAIILYRIANSRTGIVFLSILDDEVASKSCGINVTKYKLMAFAVSALFAGVAGAFSAHSLTTGRYVGVAAMGLTQSFFAVLMTALGGIGTIYGGIVGAFIITILDQYILGIEVLNIEYVWHPLLFVIPVIILVIKWPRGVSRFVTEKLDDLQEERMLEERGRWIWKRYKKK